VSTPDPFPQCTKCNKPLPEGVHHFLVRDNGANCLEVAITIYREEGKYKAEATVNE
jgi:hypothetical protein